jgi:hypothetical protein
MNKLLATMLTQIGVEEDAAHTNHGTQVEAYMAAAGLPKGGGYAWCQSEIVWCGDQAYGHDLNPVPRTGSVMKCWDTAKNKISISDVRANPSLIQSGDQFILDFGHYTGHTGLLEKIDADGTLHTVEGNSNPAWGRDGYCCARHIRHLSDPALKGFILYREDNEPNV